MQTMREYAKRTRDFAYFGDSEDWLIAHTSANVSDIVTRANHEAIKRALPEDAFTVETFRGPLSGVHGEWILIDPAAVEAVEEVERMLAGLEDYPVIDDEVLSEMEYDEAVENAARACDIARTYDERAAAAPYIVSVSEDNCRGVGYSNEYWPEDADVFFGYLHYRRAVRNQEAS